MQDYGDKVRIVKVCKRCVEEFLTRHAGMRICGDCKEDTDRRTHDRWCAEHLERRAKQRVQVVLCVDNPRATLETVYTQLREAYLQLEDQ